MRLVSSLVKNTGSVLIATMTRMGISFLLVLLVARNWGSTGLGEFSILISLFWLFHTIAILGLQPLIIREVAQDRSKTSHYISHGILISLISSLFLSGIMILFVHIADYSANIRESSLIMPVAVLFATLNLIFQSIYIAHEKSENTLIYTLVESVVRLALGVIVLLTVKKMTLLIAAYSTASVAGFLVNMLLIRRITSPVFSRFNKSFFKELIRVMPVFTGTQVVNAFSSNITVILLSLFLQVELVGYYSAAVRLVNMFRVVVNSYKTAIQPVIAKLFVQSQRELRHFMFKSIRYIMMMTLPVCIAMLIISGRLITIVFSEKFLVSAPILSIVIWTLFLYGISMVMTSLLIASHNQKYNFKVLIVSLLVRLTMIFIFVPLFGYYGAAIAAVLESITNFTLKYTFVRKNFFSIPLFLIARNILIASIAMSAVLFLGRTLNIFIMLSVAAAVYFTLLIVMKEIVIHELSILKTGSK